MSFEASETSSANRHKARECALQMLFAADMLPSGSFSDKDYWGELGLEQLYKGANELIWCVVSRIETIRSTNTTFLSLLKRIDPLDRKSSRFSRLDELVSATESLFERYRSFVDSFVKENGGDAASVHESCNRLIEMLDSFGNDVETLEGQRGSILNADDFRETIESVARVRSIIVEMIESLLPSIDLMVDLIRPSRMLADDIALGYLERMKQIDDRIKSRAEHWRIERMAIVDRNVLRLAVFEFEYLDTPNAVVINEALELARRFSTYESTQFINGILDAIRQDIEGGRPAEKPAAASK